MTRWWELEHEYVILNLRTGIVHISGLDGTECGLADGREEREKHWYGGAPPVQDVCKRCIRIVDSRVRHNYEQWKKEIAEVAGLGKVGDCRGGCSLIGQGT